MNSAAAELEMRHNARLEHRRVIANLIARLRTLYLDSKIQLEPLPETDLDPGNPTSNVQISNYVIMNNLQYLFLLK